ncbi:MAG: hypothetical protein QM617_06510 [Comamonas sp.]
MTPWLALLLALLLVCWAIGAQQRLARLRAQVMAGFVPVGEAGQRLASLIHTLVDTPASAAAPVDPASPAALPPHEALAPEAPAVLAPLRGALLQYVAALAAAQSRPLSPEAIAALNAAQQLLWALWQERLVTASQPAAGDAQTRVDHVDRAVAEPGLPAGDPARALLHQWLQAEGQYRLTAAQFNVAVDEHNRAIRQFPARALAGLMGLEPTASLALAPSSTDPLQAQT